MIDIMGLREYFLELEVSKNRNDISTTHHLETSNVLKPGMSSYQNVLMELAGERRPRRMPCVDRDDLVSALEVGFRSAQLDARLFLRANASSLFAIQQLKNSISEFLGRGGRMRVLVSGDVKGIRDALKKISSSSQIVCRDGQGRYNGSEVPEFALFDENIFWYADTGAGSAEPSANDNASYLPAIGDDDDDDYDVSDKVKKEIKSEALVRKGFVSFNEVEDSHRMRFAFIQAFNAQRRSSTHPASSTREAVQASS